MKYFQVKLSFVKLEIIYFKSKGMISSIYSVNLFPIPGVSYLEDYCSKFTNNTLLKVHEEKKSFESLSKLL